jgi:hypothetical protein
MSAVVSPEALREIGRALELRGIKTFVIRCEVDLYVVEAGYQSPPAPTPIELHYRSGEIEQFDRDGRRNEPVTDFLSLPHILWSVATHVMAREGHLLVLSNNLPTEEMAAVSFEYETVHGERVVDKLAGPALYELCVSLYKRRQTSDSKNTRYTRFSALHE